MEEPLAPLGFYATAYRACFKLNPTNPLAAAEATPDLYEALGEIVLGVKQGTTWGIEKAEKALAKARGGVE